MFGLVQYLAGPGRSNEHTDIHLVAASDSVVSVSPGTVLDAENSRMLGHELDIPKAVFGADNDKPYVFHMSVSLRADEGVQDDELWSKIAHDFMEEMGFSGSDGKPPCRWVAIRHGLSKVGNDHMHLAVSMIREDGTRWSTHNDQPRAQRTARALELKYGLARIDGVRAERGFHPKEREIARAQGLPELPRETLQRKVRAAAVASESEAEFVRRLRGTGVLVRPRFAKDSTKAVEGFSVAVKPTVAGASPIWFGGGRLARDLTLPKLRVDWNDTPEQADVATAEWQAAHRGKRVVAAGRETQTPTVEQWKTYTSEVGHLYERLRTVSSDDPALWAQVARETSGAFAAWSVRTEATPGPLADASKVLARTAQLTRFPARAEKAPLPSAKGAGMLMMQAQVGPSTRAGEAILLRQLRNTMHAMHGMYKASGQLHEAERLRAVAQDRLGSVKTALERTAPIHSARVAPGVAAMAVAERPVAAPRWVQAATEKPLLEKVESVPPLLSEEQRKLEEIKRLAAVSRPPTREGQPISKTEPQPPSAASGTGKDQHTNKAHHRDR